MCASTSTTVTTRRHPRASVPGAPPPSVDPLIERLIRHVDSDRADGLLTDAGRGDRRAFGELFDRTAPVVFGALRRALSGPGEAEQVTVNSYLRLWQAAPQFEVHADSAHRQLARFARCELIRWHHGLRRSEQGKDVAFP